MVPLFGSLSEIVSTPVPYHVFLSLCLILIRVKPVLSGHSKRRQDQNWFSAPIIAQREQSAIRLTFIKLPFVIKSFVLSILSGRLRQILLYIYS